MCFAGHKTRQANFLLSGHSSGHSLSTYSFYCGSRRFWYLLLADDRAFLVVPFWPSTEVVRPRFHRLDPNVQFSTTAEWLLRRKDLVFNGLRVSAARRMIDKSFVRPIRREQVAVVLLECWRVHYNTVRPHSSLGYKPPAPEAWLTKTMRHGEVETATRFPLLHTPDRGYLNSEIAALH